ncbi:MAG TPA: ABC transporter permease [Thermoanaerobaculia bacterium]|jgi:ABC-2 type transport system permease protein
MRRALAIMRKELLEVWRDRLSVILVLVMPPLLLVLFTTAISLSMTRIPLVVEDYDQSRESRRYVDAIRASVTFVVVTQRASAESSLQRGDARGVVVIPPNFAASLLREQPVRVQLLVDGSDANTARIVAGGVQGVTSDFASRGGGRVALQSETRLWHNAGGRTSLFIAPGAVAFCLALFPPLLAALAASRERERGTILQVYASGASAAEFAGGTVLAYAAIGLLQCLLLVVTAMGVFGLRFAGDPTPLLIAAPLYALANAAFGTLIGVASPNQASAIQGVQLTGFLFSLLLAGFIFPLSNLPVAMKWIPYLVPARYFIEVMRDTFVRGGGWPATWYVPLALLLLGALLFTAACRKMAPMQVER